MPQPYRSAVIDAPVERVWEVVRQFNGLAGWHPIIASSSLDSGAEGEVGAVRRLTTPDGAVIVERLLTLADRDRVLIYTILESPFASRDYVSTMHVAPVTDTGATFMEWWTTYDCDAADEAELAGLFGDAVFGAGLAALQQHFAS